MSTWIDPQNGRQEVEEMCVSINLFINPKHFKMHETAQASNDFVILDDQLLLYKTLVGEVFSCFSNCQDHYYQNHGYSARFNITILVQPIRSGFH